MCNPTESVPEEVPEHDFGNSSRQSNQRLLHPLTNAASRPNVNVDLSAHSSMQPYANATSKVLAHELLSQFISMANTNFRVDSIPSTSQQVSCQPTVNITTSFFDASSEYCQSTDVILTTRIFVDA